MLNLNTFIAILAFTTPCITASPNGKPFEVVKRQANLQGQGRNVTNPLQVDLGYATYEGIANSSTGLNTFLGYVCIATTPNPTHHTVVQTSAD